MHRAKSKFNKPLSHVYATNFHQTLDTLAHAHRKSNQQDATSTKIDDALAAWQKVIAAHEPEQWTRRLNWDGLEHQTARLAVSDEQHIPDQPPSWMATLDKIRAELGSVVDSAREFPVLPQRNKPTVAFQEFWLPVTAWALTQLKSSLALCVTQHISPDAWDSMRLALLQRLSNISESVLFAIFNRERNFDAMMNAYLSIGDSASASLPTTIYDLFVKRNQEDSLQAVFSEFPVLGRHLVTTIELWHATMAEFLSRLARDRELLSRTYKVDSTALVANLTLGLSDPHRGGRVVVIVHFVGNTKDAPLTKVVYKPKDMCLDDAYQRAIRALPLETGQAPLRILKLVACQGYGYMEFVEHRPAKDDTELERFYINAGRLTAVLYILGCTDCHYENLIADGDQLVLIDTETLFEAKLRNLVNDAAAQPQSRSEMQVRLSSSVTRSGLLPCWEFIGEAKQAIDVSALGAESPIEVTQKKSGWIGINSDGMMAGLIEQPSEVPGSLPYSVGKRNRFNEFLEPFCNEFHRTLLQFIQHRTAWIEPDGILDSFCGLPRRLVVRPTQTYYQIKMQLTEPDALRSASAQGFVLEKLALAFLTAPKKPKHWNIFKAELRDMEMLDVPIFEHFVDSTDLSLPHGMGKVQGFIEISGLESCRTRLRKLNLDDIDLQLRLIRGVSSARWIQLDATSVIHTDDRSAMANQSVGESTTKHPQQSLTEKARLQEAARIAANLQRDAISVEHGRIDWLGLSLGDDSVRMSYGLLDPSMYSGTSGIAVFFAALGPVHLPLARACVSETLELALNGHAGLLWRWWRDQPLGINGCGGTLLALEILSKLDAAQADRYSTAADRLIGALQADRLTVDKEFDIMAGCSGLIGALLRRGTLQSIALAKKAGDHLIASQNERGGWTLPNKQCYLGFAHGSAGICAALSALYGVTGEMRFVQKIALSLSLEQTYFHKQSNNWLTYIDGKSPPRTTWCHGAPGIALSRLCLLSNNVTAAQIGTRAYAQVQSDLDLSLNTTANFRSAAPLDHLCCGTFGRSGILRLAGRTTEASQIDLIAYTAATQQGGLYGFGHTALVETPSLFRGSAGVGLSLLQSPCVSTVLSAGLLG